MANSLRCPVLAYLSAGGILLTIHLCFAVSVWQGIFEPCNPYWSDCESISRAGRHGLAYFLFKGGMIPVCLLLGFFWQLNRAWLQSLGSDARSLPALGWTASFALLVYTLSLGHSGDAFYLLRRFGVVFFLGLSFIAFVRLSAALLHTRLRDSARLLRQSLGFILGVALFSLVLDAWLGSDYDRLENAFEWWLILLLTLQLFWIARLWQRSDFRLTATVAGSGS